MSGVEEPPSQLLAKVLQRTLSLVLTLWSSVQTSNCYLRKIDHFYRVFLLGYFTTIVKILKDYNQIITDYIRQRKKLNSLFLKEKQLVDEVSDIGGIRK